jgi:RNA polymerase sigma factor (sigma-70 family)
MGKTSDPKDYLIEIKIKNNHLLKKIMECGYKNVSEFARTADINQTVVAKYVTLKQPAIDRNGRWRKSVEKMAEALNCAPADLFPPQHIEKALKRNSASFEAGIEEVAVFLTGGEDTARTALEHVTQEESMREVAESFEFLTPKEQHVLRLRFGMDNPEESTLQEVAEIYGVTRESIRHIEARALRKLKHPKASRNLREAAAGLGIVPRYSNEPVARHYVPEWKR